ncbi:MAG: hypothetical protein Q8P49_02260 [Candidatus Liptonbacteria bacterium]|nr:hypothetical protein [Candidatus Liptonbacteria bacterium]
MLDIKLLREEPEKVKKGIKAKNFDPRIVDEFLKLDEEWRELTAALDGKRAEQKKLSGKIAAPKGVETRPEELSGREEAKKNK